MQHQYWVTKKSVSRKLGGKEDDCIVSSDAELDAKLELFKSITESCNHLQRVIDLYQERLCYLAQEENALGRYIKECGKNEKNAYASQILSTCGKALAYTGHQRLTVRPSLIRLHHEVETFRVRAITDTKATIVEMEKVRTEYRAALSWMKSASTQLDPDTGHGLEQFRKAQSYVKKTKTKFDRLTLACLQKVDLLAAARCNMFSHVLVPYQNALMNFSTKAAETFDIAAVRLDNVQPLDSSTILESLAIPIGADKDRNTFFNADYSDQKPPDKKEKKSNPESFSESQNAETNAITATLLDGDFSSPKILEEPKIDESKPSSALLDLDWSTDNSDFLSGDFMPSKLIQNDIFKIIQDNPPSEPNAEASNQKLLSEPTKENNQVSWLSLFAELDPLANSPLDDTAGNRV